MNMLTPISDKLRMAILKGPSRYRIAKATGIAESTLSRFVNGKTSMDLDTVDKLAAFLGLALIETRRADNPPSKSHSDRRTTRLRPN